MNDPKPDAIRRLSEAGGDSARLEARLLWDHAQRNPTIFEALVVRRLAHEPLAYITGHKEFWSLEFEVGPGVLVPRPETETIVEQVLDLFPDAAAPLRVLDLGTGTGCLLIAILKEFPNSHGLGIDCSEQALRIASTNIERHGLRARAEVRSGNWGEALDGAWDVIVSNPPYIKSGELASLPADVFLYEPVGALDGGPDGLVAIRELGRGMARLCRGYGFIEIGVGQADEAAAALANSHLDIVRIAPDLAGIPRVLVTRPAGLAAKKVLE